MLVRHSKRRRLCTWFAGAITAGLGVVGVPARSPAVPPPFIEFRLGALGPRGPLVLIGDSVLLGSVWSTEGYGPSLAQMLVDRGWGPVDVKAGGGFATGQSLPAGHGANMATWVARHRQLTGGASAYAVVLGHGDILACGGSTACAEAGITKLAEAIGPAADTWWSKITMTDPADASAWNGALDRVAATRSTMRQWDWPAVQPGSGIPLAGDGIHLPTADAYRRRSELIAAEITAQLGAARAVAAVPVAFPAGGTPSTYLPIAPTRVLDTRRPSDGRRTSPSEPIVVELAALVPATATAVSVNLTVDGHREAGYLTAYPCGSAPPNASNLNFAAGQARGAHAVVAVDAQRQLCVIGSVAAGLIVDLQGAFVPDGGLRLAPQVPERVLDSRASGRSTIASVPVVGPGVTGTAVAVNLTATGSSAGGYLTAYPCGGAVPEVSNVNFQAGETVAGAAFVPTGTAGSICVASNVPVDVIVDVTARFSTRGAMRFVPAAAPTRVLDTRTGIGGWIGSSAPGQVFKVVATPPGVAMVTGTITLLATGSNAFLSAYPCASTPPGTSNVNAAPGVTAANSVTVTVDLGLCISTSAAGRVLFDTTGWWQ